MMKIKVLIVDDSLLFREWLRKGLTNHPNIEVVATAVDAFDARDKILMFEPDVMTCDVEMPKMNGLEFIRRLLPQYPLPTIMISTVSTRVFDALNSGAVDFVSKPVNMTAGSTHVFFDDLIQRIRVAANINLEELRRDQGVMKPVEPRSGMSSSCRIIAMGASTGGTEAITSILKMLPVTVPGIVIVQHIPSGFSKMFADRLNQLCKISVKEAKTGDYVEAGTALIAPGDQHMRLHKAGTAFRVECYPGERVTGHCPSVDVLFDSVAKEAGGKAIGVILTGMGYDGSKGLLMMRRKGGRTIGQDAKSSVVYGMPKAAFDVGAVEQQVPLSQIPQLINKWLQQ
ncbi:protein-glutamate methylesterase/protein-glutamine glutaminase [Paenibacillus wynnii]|uniref:protein-glutamate methylesterase/protein-glutamine glutaminase n=1 Tax=Paenibacillus wynnii TaxID=268407 RepID=UPI00278D35D9|nr:chemotaxis response regulator protein-glutamate methylesterase [Paenibacillus wynnii]MDQ0192453.1 two-component system chemotaxis response regulator CheB [Paenibacillus wynnii]